MQSAAIISHGPEMAIGRRGGFEWWTSYFFWAQETQDLIQRFKGANMLFQKYVDLRRSYVLFKPRWPLEKLSWYQHSVHPLPLSAWGLSLQPNFWKGGTWQDLNFERGLLGKRGGDFFQGVAVFFIKNKLKSKIFNDKKLYKQKCFSPS